MKSILTASVSWWSNLDPSMQSTLIAQFVTIILAVAGGFGVLWRSGKNAELARNQERESEAQKLKLRIYEDFATRCEQAMQAHIELANYVRNLILELGAYSKSEKNRDEFKKISARTPQLLNLYGRKGDVVSALMGNIERWQIIDPRLELFLVAFSALGDEIGDAFEALFYSLYDKMPTEIQVDGIGGMPLPPMPLSDAELEQISRFANVLNDKLNTQLGYITDLRIEVQNLLLGDLFSGRLVPKRKPNDSSIMVLSLDDHENLRNRLLTETDGGKRLKQIEEQSKRSPDRA